MNELRRRVKKLEQATDLKDDFPRYTFQWADGTVFKDDDIGPIGPYETESGFSPFGELPIEVPKFEDPPRLSPEVLAIESEIRATVEELRKDGLSMRQIKKILDAEDEGMPEEQGT